MLKRDNKRKLDEQLFTCELQVPERLPSGDIEAIFSLCDSDYTFSMWQVFTFVFLESDFEKFPASIPHLLSHHTEGKRAASEHRSVQPEQGNYLRRSFFNRVGKCFDSQETPFDFNVLLHSYFKCPDVRRCQVNPRKPTAAMISKILTEMFR